MEVVPIGFCERTAPILTTGGRHWSGGTVGHGDGQCWAGRAGAAVRFWEQNGSGDARSGGLRRGDRYPTEAADLGKDRYLGCLAGGALSSHRGGQGFESPQLHPEVFTFHQGLCSRLGLTFSAAGGTGARRG